MEDIDSWFDSWQEQEISLFSTLPVIQQAVWPYLPGLNQSEHEADCSPPSNFKVKNEWNYTCFPLYAVHNENFTTSKACLTCTGCSNVIELYFMVISFFLLTFKYIHLQFIPLKNTGIEL